jgi:hypothetical protein
VQALQRQELVPAELGDPLRGREVFETVQPEIDEGQTVARSNQQRGRGRNEHLPAVARCSDARRAMHVVPTYPRR